MIKERLESPGGRGKSPHPQTSKKSRRLDVVAVITDSVLCWVGEFHSRKFANDLDEFIGLDTGLHGCGWLIVLVAIFFAEPAFICFLYRNFSCLILPCFSLIFCHFLWALVQDPYQSVVAQSVCISEQWLNNLQTNPFHLFEQLNSFAMPTPILPAKHIVFNMLTTWKCHHQCQNNTSQSIQRNSWCSVWLHKCIHSYETYRLHLFL